MKLEIKMFCIDEPEENVDKYSQSPSALSVTIGIGEVGSDAYDNYHLHICNRMWVNKIVDEFGICSPEKCLIIDEIDDEKILGYISQEYLGDDYPTYQHFIDRVSTQMAWELADFRAD